MKAINSWFWLDEGDPSELGNLARVPARDLGEERRYKKRPERFSRGIKVLLPAINNRLSYRMYGD